MKDRSRHPLFTSLQEYKHKRPCRFHVPGHKGGVFFHAEGESTFHSILSFDVTELTGLDDLHDPREAIAEAQHLAAQTFFADRTYFLVNGSSIGNVAMILSTIEKGERILVQRNAHKSVFHALALAEAEVYFIEPMISPCFHVPIGLTLQQVEQAFTHIEDIKALFLTSPNYYGMSASELTKVISFAHQQGAVVLVDEAHGAHFGQHHSLPPSAMQLNADACVQSTHKMLGSMTMSSMLHLKEGRIPRTDIEYYLRSLQSSSPSYPLLASLDLARSQLETLTERDWDKSITAYAQLRKNIEDIGHYGVAGASQQVFHHEQWGKETITYHLDPFKLTIQPMFHCTGYQFKHELEKHKIYVELADTYQVLLTLPLCPIKDWNDKLLFVLQQIAAEYKDRSKPPDSSPIRCAESHTTKVEPYQELRRNKHCTKVRMRVLRAKEQEEIPLEDAVGYKAAEMLVPYPPGIPLCVPMETITEQLLREIKLLQQNRAYFQGKPDQFTTIKIVKEVEDRNQSCTQ